MSMDVSVHRRRWTLPPGYPAPRIQTHPAMGPRERRGGAVDVSPPFGAGTAAIPPSQRSSHTAAGLWGVGQRARHEWRWAANYQGLGHDVHPHHWLPDHRMHPRQRFRPPMLSRVAQDSQRCCASQPAATCSGVCPTACPARTLRTCPDGRGLNGQWGLGARAFAWTAWCGSEFCTFPSGAVRRASARYRS